MQCPQCKTRHLIADNIGWFKDLTKEIGGKNIEEIAELKGEEIKKQLEQVTNLEDLQYIEKEAFTKEELTALIDENAKIGEN